MKYTESTFVVIELNGSDWCLDRGRIAASVGGDIEEAESFAKLYARDNHKNTYVVCAPVVAYSVAPKEDEPDKGVEIKHP